MGWPNFDPEGWAEVEREAVKVWMVKGLVDFYSLAYNPNYPEDLLSWLQAEHGDVFWAMVEAVGPFRLSDAEADHLERKFSVGETP